MTEREVGDDWAVDELGVFSEDFREVFGVFAVSELSEDKARYSMKDASVFQMCQHPVDGICCLIDIFDC